MLVVAQVGQTIQRSLLANAHDGIHHHGARRRRATRRMQNCRPLLVGHRHGTVVVITREGTREERCSNVSSTALPVVSTG